ncbi:hypothetical protein C5167_043230 [Papaver somniferum]|uniref:Uncharacterized protein n=1 Tax=Papaver somniferum TaxID=3469 RepID=A0A4Y7L6S6_PAPSO|nr:hypothetical protein C5167_043230 [Papaver somniferum]
MEWRNFYIMVHNGAKSEQQSKLAAIKYARIIQKLRFPAMFKGSKIHTTVGSCHVEFPIRLERLSYSHGPFLSVSSCSVIGPSETIDKGIHSAKGKPCYKGTAKYSQSETIQRSYGADCDSRTDDQGELAVMIIVELMTLVTLEMKAELVSLPLEAIDDEYDEQGD